MTQDRSLQVAKLRPRIEPGPLAELVPRAAVGSERVRLATAAVEREHQLALQALPDRVVARERLYLAMMSRCCGASAASSRFCDPNGTLCLSIAFCSASTSA